MCFNNVPLFLSPKDLLYRRLRTLDLFWPSTVDVENSHWYRSTDHAGLIMSEQIVCNYCGRTFNSLQELEGHESDHLLNPEHRSWECNLCRRTFYQSLSLEQHLHSKHNSCRFCDKRAAVQSPAMLASNSMEVEEEKKYCGNCDRSFPTLLDFMQHDQTVHISCQFCDQIGSRKNRRPFDSHCCGCHEVLDGNEALSKHLQNHPQHHHGHSDFIMKPQLTAFTSPPRQTALPALGSAGIPASLDITKSRLVHLSPMSAAGIQFTRTPATPIAESSHPSQAPTLLSRKRPRSQRLPSNVRQRSVPRRPEFLCTDCRIIFPDGPTLLRHQSFSFLRTAGCSTKFTCPFSLLRHIEAGTCCHWKSPDQS